MQNILNKAPQYAPAILRYGIAGVVMWFGLSQILDQSIWQSFIPDWVVSITGISAKSLVLGNGIFETVAAGLMAIGVLVRPLALLLAIHMGGIIMTLGISPTGVRDIGIAVGLLAVACYGNDILSWKSPTSSPQ